jgi:hypothetical protein
MLASNKVDFRAKNNDQGQSLTFYDKTSAHWEYIRIVNMYALNNRATKHIKQKMMKLPGMMWYPSAWEAEAEQDKFETSLDYRAKHCLKKKKKIKGWG